MSRANLDSCQSLRRPDLAQTLESVSGGEPDRHARVESAQCLEKLIESILEVIPEDLRINEELSDVAAFQLDRHHTKTAWQRTSFYDVTGGLLDESGWRDWWRSTGVLSWACGSMSCEVTGRE